MFWNKNKTSWEVSECLQILATEMNRVDEVYADPRNVDSRITTDQIFSFTGEANTEKSRTILDHYIRQIKLLARYRQDREDLKKIVEGNGGFWGQYQENYKECQGRLSDAMMKLGLEKDMYMKLYERNRELEAKLYTVERELEILKTGAVK